MTLLTNPGNYPEQGIMSRVGHSTLPILHMPDIYNDRNVCIILPIQTTLTELTTPLSYTNGI